MSEKGFRCGPAIGVDGRPIAGRKHAHYFKPCPYAEIDVYRVLELFGVADPCIQYAVKKLLVAGGRGTKDISRDVQEAIDTLERWKEMVAEERAALTVSGDGAAGD